MRAENHAATNAGRGDMPLWRRWRSFPNGSRGRRCSSPFLAKCHSRPPRWFAIGLDDNGSVVRITAAQKICADPPLGNVANATVDDAPVAADLVDVLGGYRRQIDVQNGEIGIGASLGPVKKFDADAAVAPVLGNRMQPVTGLERIVAVEQDGDLEHALARPITLRAESCGERIFASLITEENGRQANPIRKRSGGGDEIRTHDRALGPITV